MSDWLKFLSIELQDITSDKFLEPGADNMKGDREVGEMDDDLKRLWTLWQFYQKVAAKCTFDIKYEPGANIKELSVKKTEFQAKAEVLRDIFWIAVKDKFGLWYAPSIGVRKGFIVVEMEEHEGPDSFFRRLFGKEL
ncbi:unnamed protein product [marine sediment metagenome]|uniref:Uncharacterized protein n=1 Tax=marine sediment metagenome TaxID=412755 RepID=X1PQD4_9ZZZZ